MVAHKVVSALAASPLWEIVQEVIGSNPISDSCPLSVKVLGRERWGMPTTGLQELECPLAKPG